MKKIKFRVYDWLACKIRYPEIFTISADTISFQTEDGYLSFELKYASQFTGVTDKNGKEIYEGDIDNKKRVCEYFPALGSFGFKSPKYSTITLLGQFVNSKQEIIGNIYELDK